MKKEITFEELEIEFGKDFAKIAMQEIEKEEKEANDMLGTSWYGTTTCDECKKSIKICKKHRSGILYNRHRILRLCV